MARVKFNLDKPKKELSYILLKFSFQGKPFRYSTGLKIPPNQWNSNRQRLIESNNSPNNAEHNLYLDQLEGVVTKLFRSRIDNNKSLKKEEIKEHLDIYRGKSKKVTEDSFFPFVRQLIEDRTNSPVYKPATIKDYTITHKKIKDYCDKKRIREFDFEDLDLAFFEKFTNYLYKEHKHSRNYVHKIIKTLKTFINDAKAKGIKTNEQYKKFLIKKTETENIYLSVDELSSIYNLDLSEREGLERVRDLFLIGAYTGLRYSDFSSLKKENLRIIEDIEVFNIKTEKTGEVVIIPLHPIVKAILNKYDNQPPKAISNQKTNEALKIIAKQAEINESLIITKNKAGVDYQLTLKKYELVTTHTARRSFATNAFKAGISSISIMKITGHKSETSFLKYIKITKEENAIIMAKNPFFKMSPVRKVG